MLEFITTSHTFLTRPYHYVGSLTGFCRLMRDFLRSIKNQNALLHYRMITLYDAIPFQTSARTTKKNPNFLTDVEALPVHAAYGSNVVKSGDIRRYPALER